MEDRIAKLPKWAQQMIADYQREQDRLQRNEKRMSDRIADQSEEIQNLLDIMCIVRPDLHEHWNHGVKSKELLELSKKPPVPVDITSQVKLTAEEEKMNRIDAIRSVVQRTGISIGDAMKVCKPEGGTNENGR